MDVNLDIVKKKIGDTEVIEELMILGEKIFRKNDDAVCIVTYLLEKAYMMGKNYEKMAKSGAPTDDDD